MDYEDIIKLQEQSPVYSTGNHSHTLKQYMAAFYDNDSQIQRREPTQEISNSHYISFEQAIDYIQNYVDIIDTPLDEILLCFDRFQCGQDLDKTTLRKKILKRKNLLKRFRAKNRQPKFLCSYQNFCQLNPVQVIETEAQIKKKRNRVSAQISRDRKKQYFKELEMKNQKLQEQIIRTRLQNEKLKKQAQDNQNKPKQKIHSENLNNKLTKLLIFLGIICLISILKETFASTTQSLSKFKFSQKLEQFSSPDNKIIVQALPKVAEFLEDEQVDRQLSANLQKRIPYICSLQENERNSKDCNSYIELMQKLDSIKSKIETQNFNE